MDFCLPHTARSRNGGEESLRDESLRWIPVYAGMTMLGFVILFCNVVMDC